MTCVETHQVYIYDRGGMKRLGHLRDLSQVQWERTRDHTSEASVRIEGASCDRQADLLRRLSVKRHEMVVFRGEDRVWEGPLWRIGDHGNYMEIVARDVTTYLYGTPLTRAWDNRYSSTAGVVEVTTRLEQIITYELQAARTVRAIGGEVVSVPAWESLDPPVNLLPYLSVHHFPNEARTAAYTQAYEMTVGEHLANCARSSGVDYTAIGRGIHLWDTSRPLGRTRALSEQDFYGRVVVSEYGAEHDQINYVIGQEGVYGEALNPDHLDYYGPWTTVDNAYSEEGANAPSVGELNSQASRNLTGRSPAPVEVRIPDGSTIRLGNGLSIRDLVPGVQLPLTAALNTRGRTQVQRLDVLRVTESVEGERVAVTLTPATRPDSDESEE